MIPSDPDTIKKMRELAERNIANGDWGDEVTLPNETMPISPTERLIKTVGKKKLPKEKS